MLSTFFKAGVALKQQLIRCASIVTNPPRRCPGWDLGVWLTTDSSIKKLNAQCVSASYPRSDVSVRKYLNSSACRYRHIDEATDVLSFTVNGEAARTAKVPSAYLCTFLPRGNCARANRPNLGRMGCAAAGSSIGAGG